MDEVSTGLIPSPSGFGSVGGVRCAAGRSAMYWSGCVSGRDGCFIPHRPAKNVSGITVAVAHDVGSVAPKLVIGAQSAKAAGLRYATCDKPGISRQRRGKTFIYKDSRGRVIT